MNNKIIGIFVGSLRKDSNSKKIAENLVQMMPEGFRAEIIEIGRLQLYNQDYDGREETPYSYIAFRKVVKDLDGLLFVTPEYNRSIPGVLKNALDVASRPAGESVWGGKPAAIVSSSRGRIGGFGANHHLRQCLTFLNVYTMQQPEAYLTDLSPASFDENNRFVDNSQQQFIQKFLDAYIAWFKRFV